MQVNFLKWCPNVCTCKSKKTVLVARRLLILRWLLQNILFASAFRVLDGCAGAASATPLNWFFYVTRRVRSAFADPGMHDLNGKNFELGTVSRGEGNLRLVRREICSCADCISFRAFYFRYRRVQRCTGRGFAQFACRIFSAAVPGLKRGPA